MGLLQGLLFLFMGSMIGIVIADNLVVLYVFWELTTISSFLMIGLEHKEEESRENAWQALLVTAIGGLAMLAGFFLIYFTTGTYSISELIQSGSFSEESRFLIPIILLLLAGAFTKSAQFPFHFWLPSAMVAPTPVSAYLHSATMVKAGVFLIMRLNPVFADFDLWQYLLLGFGGFTMVFGAVVAVGKHDLKEILAYSTISTLGLLIFLTGSGTEQAYIAAITYLIVHAFYKAGLFMVAGIIDHSAHTRDLRKVSGLFSKMPVTATAAFLLGLSYAGLPPALGYIGKELVYEATLHGEFAKWLSTGSAFVANICIVATAFMTGIQPFTGKLSSKGAEIHHKPSALLYTGPIILGICGVLAGTFSHFTGKTFVETAGLFLGMEKAEPHLKLWHGFNLTLLIGTVTLVSGFLIWLLRPKLLKYLYEKINTPGTVILYKKGISGLLHFSKVLTYRLQTGYIVHYIWWIIGTFILLGTSTLLLFPYTEYKADITEVVFYKALTCLIILAGAFTVIMSKEVLSAVAALGIVGYGIALVFVFYGAPDLAMTQFATETLSVLLFVLVVYKYPSLTTIGKHPRKIRDIVLSVSLGLFMSVMVILIIHSSSDEKISSFYLNNAFSEAHGKNVVNIILVDFRAMDTLGETVVLSIAALGVYGLLRVKKDGGIKE